MLLKEIGVFKGSEAGFELERAPTRLEGLIMLLRLMGLEDEALNSKISASVFSDVPEWGVPYTNYAYRHDLTNGIGNMRFGSFEPLEANAYSTFVLRALGYDDSIGDFNYSNAADFLSELLPFNIESKGFFRGDVASISYYSMYLKHQKTDLMLISTLVQSGDIPQESYALFSETLTHTYSNSTTLIDASGNEEYLNFTIKDDMLVITARRTIPDEYVWVIYNNNNAVFRFDEYNLEESIDISQIDGDLSLSIFLCSNEYGDYTSWIYDYSIPETDHGLVFEISPVLERNTIYYSSNQALKAEYLEEEYLINPDHPDISKKAKEITTGLSDDYDKSKAIHIWLASNIYYDMDGLSASRSDLNQDINVLYDRIAVCEGYSSLAVSLLRSLGIPARKVSGYANNVVIKGFYRSNGELISEPNHTWYEAYVNDRWIICDSTWDSKNIYRNGEFEAHRYSMDNFDMSLTALSTYHLTLIYR